MTPLVLALALFGASASGGVRLDLLAFFEGRTHGVGVFDPIVGRSRGFEVDGDGRRQPDGTLVLTQQIRWSDGDTDRRVWRMRRTSSNTIEGRLSDGRGAAKGRTVGASARLSYMLDKGPGVRMDHRMVLQPGGRVVVQQVRASVFGMPVAAVRETITRRP